MNKLIRITAMFIAVLVIGSYNVPAQEPNEEEQPLNEVFQTVLVYPQEKGETQITMSSTFGRGSSRNIFQTPLSIEYGLTKKWLIELEWDSASRRRELGEGAVLGMGDVRLGTKYSFMNMRGSKFHSAIGVELGLPTGNVDKELSEGVVELEPYFILARDLPTLNGAQLFTQIGVGFVKRVKERRGEFEREPTAHELSWNSGVFVPFRKVILTGELNWQTNRWNRRGDESELYITPGIVWHPARGWEFGIGFPVGLTHDADHIRTISKVNFEF
jgi:hypothetical protein